MHTGADVGGNGDSNATSSPNHAYVSTAVAEAAEAQNLVSGGHTQEFQCEGSAADTTQVAFGDDWTTGATNNILVNPHANDINTTRIYDTSKYRLEQSSGHTSCFKVTGSSCGHVEANGLQMSIGAATSDCYRVDASVTGGVYIVRGCWMKGSGSGSNQVGAYIAQTGDGTVHLINNVIYETGNECIELRSNAADEINVYNNTLDSAGTYGLSISSGGATVKARNNLMTNCTTADYTSSGSPTTTANITGDEYGPNSTEVDVTYTDASGDDYSTSDTDVVGQGGDLSADGDFAFSTDIMGVTRSAWDAGAFEHVASGTGNPHNYYAQLQ